VPPTASGTARPIYDPGVDNQTLGNIIVVLPDGTLLDVFSLILMRTQPTSSASVALIRSVDHGDSWSTAITVAPIASAPAHDPDGVFVRSGGELPTVAVDPVSGAVYVAWEDGGGSSGAVDGILMSVSHDGGRTWSPPAPVNQDRAHDAFTPSLSAAAGTIALSYFDTRTDDPADRSQYFASAWLARSPDGGATWSEDPLGGAFDLKAARFGDVYFLGDYQGLAVTRTGSFVPFFARAAGGGDDPSDIFVRPTDIAP
jgi:hypothetical protein